MGRKNSSLMIPRPSRGERERAKWRSAELVVPRSFGVRRHLETDSARRLMMGVRQLQLFGELPGELDLMLNKTYVDLLPLGLIGRQTIAGVVTDYDVADLGSHLKRQCDGANLKSVEGEIKSVSMKTGGNLRITLESDTLEKDRLGIADTLEYRGFKGLRRWCGQTALHVDIATCRRDELSYEARLATENTIELHLDNINPLREPLVFGGWDIYPKTNTPT